MKFATLVLACAVLASVEARPKNTSAVKTWKKGSQDPEELCSEQWCDSSECGCGAEQPSVEELFGIEDSNTPQVLLDLAQAHIDKLTGKVDVAQPVEAFNNIPKNTSSLRTGLIDTEKACEVCWTNNKHTSQTCCGEEEPTVEELFGIKDSNTPQILLDLDDAMAHVDMLTGKDDVAQPVKAFKTGPKSTSAVKSWKKGFLHPEVLCYYETCCSSGECYCCGAQQPSVEELFGIKDSNTPQVLLDLDDALAHVDKLTGKDDVAQPVEAFKTGPKNTSAVKTWKQGFKDPEEDCPSCCTSYGTCWCCGDEQPSVEELFGIKDSNTPQVLLDLDDALAHVDKLSGKDDLTVALDEAMEHVDMLTAIDDAFAHIDMMTAIDEAMDHVDMMQKHQASGSGYTTPIIASAGALLAIGAGFVLKNKFSAVGKKDIEETLL